MVGGLDGRGGEALKHSSLLSGCGGRLGAVRGTENFGDCCTIDGGLGLLHGIGDHSHEGRKK